MLGRFYLMFCDERQDRAGLNVQSLAATEVVRCRSLYHPSRRQVASKSPLTLNEDGVVFLLFWRRRGILERH